MQDEISRWFTILVFWLLHVFLKSASKFVSCFLPINWIPRAYILQFNNHHFRSVRTVGKPLCNNLWAWFYVDTFSMIYKFTSKILWVFICWLKRNVRRIMNLCRYLSIDIWVDICTRPGNIASAALDWAGTSWGPWSCQHCLLASSHLGHAVSGDMGRVTADGGTTI